MVDDPLAAMATLEELPASRERNQAVLAGLSALSKQDPGLAGRLFLDHEIVDPVPYIMSSPMGEEDYFIKYDQGGTVRDVFVGWAAIDREAAIAGALSIGDDSTFQRAIWQLAETWAAQDFDAAIAWANSLADADRGSIELSELAIRSASQASLGWSGERAAAFCRANSDHPAFRGALRAWALADPVGVLGWIESDSHPVRRVRRAEEIVSTIVGQNWGKTEEIEAVTNSLVSESRDPDVRRRLERALPNYLRNFGEIGSP